jgi:methylmalonyl-CoA mutase N-terminal domain/subunit
MYGPWTTAGNIANIALLCKWILCLTQQAFHRPYTDQAPEALERLKQVEPDNSNIFDELLEAVSHCILGQITKALREVGEKYRDNIWRFFRAP